MPPSTRMEMSSRELVLLGAIKGSTRPPEISPELWRISTAKQKAEAIKTYQDELAGIRLDKSTPAAPASSGVPKLPRTTEPTPTAHRDKIAEESTTVYPTCIARKLSRREWELAQKRKRPLTQNRKTANPQTSIPNKRLRGLGRDKRS